MKQFFYLIAPCVLETEGRSFEEEELYSEDNPNEFYLPWVEIVMDSGDRDNFIHLPNCFLSGGDAQHYINLC